MKIKRRDTASRQITAASAGIKPLPRNANTNCYTCNKRPEKYFGRFIFFQNRRTTQLIFDFGSIEKSLANIGIFLNPTFHMANGTLKSDNK